VLDALPRGDAAALRSRLLAPLRHRLGQSAGGAAPESPDSAGTVVARFSPQWLWYAPFSGGALVTVGALAGTAFQVVDSIHVRISEEDLALFSPAGVAAGAVLAVLLLAGLLVLGSLLVNGDFVLVRQGATWHIGRGLLTHRETTIDVARLAGVSVAEPAVLRLLRGGRVTAIVTGLRGRQQRSSTLLLPAAPRRTAISTATAVLGTPLPVTAALRRHGRTAAVRRFTRALLVTTPLVVVVLGVIAAGAPAALAVLALAAVAVALALAADRARSLGHAHLAGHVVVRSGSLLRSREALADGHVIGWNLRATWFQRRAGLVSVAATTAGGAGRVAVPDVPTADALALALCATPGLLDDFLDRELRAEQRRLGTNPRGSQP
jgi:putative membrane protein